MNTTITCKNCGEQIEISEALKHQLEEELLKAQKEQHKKDLIAVEAHAKEAAQKSVREELDLKMKLLSEEAVEQKKRAKEREEQLLELTRQMRQLQEAGEKQRLDLEKKLIEEQEKIKEDVRKRLEDEHKLKDLEKDKMIADQKKALEDMNRKLEQGSQQTQGEVLELEIEAQLRAKFPYDQIAEVPKGIKGADIVQVLKDKMGVEYGKIVWELKNAKWSDQWIPKLKDDQRVVKAEIAILVSVDLPKGIKLYDYRDGVWVCSMQAYLELAYSIHFALYKEYQVRVLSSNKHDKMEELFQYITGNDFILRMQGIRDSYERFRKDIEDERRFMERKWARQEKELLKLMSATDGIYGELQAVTNRALPDMTQAELLPEE